MRHYYSHLRRVGKAPSPICMRHSSGGEDEANHTFLSKTVLR